MEKRDEIKESVKAEIIKLMAQELKQDSEFEKIKTELAQELFNLKPAVEVEEEPKFIRTLNSNWGYDPINKREEKVKQMFGFLWNPEDIKKGFNGQVLTKEQDMFMKESAFAKQALIDELKEKIEEIKNSINEKPSFEEDESELQLQRLPSSNTAFEKSASEKLSDFKSDYYGNKAKQILTDAFKNNDLSKDYKDFIQVRNDLILQPNTTTNPFSETNPFLDTNDYVSDVDAYRKQALASQEEIDKLQKDIKKFKSDVEAINKKSKRSKTKKTASSVKTAAKKKPNKK